MNCPERANMRSSLPAGWTLFACTISSSARVCVIHVDKPARPKLSLPSIGRKASSRVQLEIDGKRVPLPGRTFFPDPGRRGYGT